MGYPWAVGEVLHATDLNAAIASAAAGAGPGLPVAGISGYLYGLTLANDAVTPNTVLNVAAGACANSTGTLMITLGAFTKSTSGAWIAGTGQPGMGGGLTATISTWYHVFAIVNAGVSDVFFDTSVTAAHAPLGTTSFRRIGSFKINSSGQIVSFRQIGNHFDLSVAQADYNSVPGVTTAQTLTLTLVPSGLPIEAILTGAVLEPTAVVANVYVSALYQADQPPGPTVFTAKTPGPANTMASFNRAILTDASGQIRFRVSTTGCNLTIMTMGWMDNRGILY